MGEESKEEEKKEENKEDDNKTNKEEDEAVAPPEIVLKVDMHCDACARKIACALKGLEGVEEVSADSESSRVVVKGKAADPAKVCERLQKKSGRKVELISPLPKPTEETSLKEEAREQPNEEQKEEPPAAVTVVLCVRMHCEACAQVLRKRVRKIKGVESVETDMSSDRVIVKGIIEPQTLVDNVKKRTGKRASIVKDEDEEKKEKEGSGDDNKDGDDQEKKEGESGKGEDDDDNGSRNKSDIKCSEHWPSNSKYYTEYAMPPQIFSDENPNACSVM